jgi:hypothetical protein
LPPQEQLSNGFSLCDKGYSSPRGLAVI